MDSVTREADWAGMIAGVVQSVGTYDYVPPVRSNPQTSRLVGETVGSDREKPGWTWTKEALCMQQVLELRIGLVELKQYFIRARPPDERDALRTVQTTSSR